MVVCQVDIGKGHRTRVTQHPAFVRLSLFSHASRNIHRRNHRRVVRPGDGNRNVLSVRSAVPVIDGDGIDLRQLLTNRQIIKRSVIDRVSPGHVIACCTRIHHRGRVNYQAAQRRPDHVAASIPYGARHADRVVIGQVHVGKGHRTRVTQHPAFVRLSFFSHASRNIHGRNYRCIVRASNGDCDVLGIRSTVPVIDGNGIDLGQLLACRQIIECSVIDRIGPFEVIARRTRIRHRGWADVEGAKRRANDVSITVMHRSRNADGMVIRQVDITERQPSVITQGAAFTGLGFFRNAAANINTADHRGIVHPGDGNHDIVAGHPKMGVRVEHREGFSARLALRQELHFRIIKRVGPVSVLIEGERAVFSIHRNSLGLPFGNRFRDPAIRTLHGQEIQIDRIDIAERKIASRSLFTILDDTADIPGDCRAIIGPENPDGDLLIIESPLIIGYPNRVVLGHHLTGSQGLCRRIVHRIDPLAGRIDGNRAIGPCIRPGNTPGFGRPGHIDIMRMQLARGRINPVFNSQTRVAAAMPVNLGSIVRPRDGDYDAIRVRTHSIRIRHREDLGPRLALRQELHLGIIQRIDPLPSLVKRQRTVRPSNAHRTGRPFKDRLRDTAVRALHRQRVHVQQVDVAEADRARCRQSTIFNYRADIPCHRRQIVRPRNSNRECCRVRILIPVRRHIIKRIFDLLSLCQGLNHFTAVVQRIDVMPVGIQQQRTILSG